MRIRRKKWAKEELENAKFYIDKPEEFKGNWNSKFSKKQDLHIELGCGKGSFISNLASSHRNINYIAVDMIEAMLGLSKRNIENSYNFEYPENLFLIRANVEQIFNVFDENDKIKRIYINFCNPWPKGKHRKKRLTHTRQLTKYKEFLSENGEIYFKTDDDELFNASLIFSFKSATFSKGVFNSSVNTKLYLLFSLFVAFIIDVVVRKLLGSTTIWLFTSLILVVLKVISSTVPAYVPTSI